MIYGDINIDFTVIESGETNAFHVLDNSYWQFIENKPAIIEVTTPGEDKPAVTVYTKNGLNNFNSTNLNLNCPTNDCEELELLDLPDGIYEITVKGSPSSFYKTKRYLRKTKFSLELAKQMVNLYNENCNVCDENKKTLREIKSLIDFADSFMMIDDCEMAQNLFFKAQKKLKKLSGCKNCL